MLALVFLISPVVPVAGRAPAKVGAVLMVGGGPTPREAVQEFLRLAGGPDARIVVLAHTQEDPVAGGERSAAMFRELGARQVVVPERSTQEAVVSALHGAEGVWIPGGDQNRFVRAFPETSRVPGAIREVVRRGGVVGGTSAGASLMGEKMPTGVETRARGLAAGACPVSGGLGVLPGAIVDQHFLARNRLMRLLAAVLEHPGYTGIGVDEEAWAVVRAGRLQAYQGQVVVIRTGRTTRAREGLLGADRVLLQVLVPGQSTRL
ncbi:MAG: cyanophycinase [Chthonomonadaceae bacterium]|nr:cyanophycinase [Chthonomonadaceae bacterium]